MAIKTLLITLITILGYSEWITGTSYLQRPIILGPLVGLALGNPAAGLQMGATMELAMIGMVSIGGFTPPDLVSGTVLGVSLAIVSGGDASAALTLGIPVATIVLAMQSAIGAPLELLVIHACDRFVDEGKWGKFTAGMVASGYVFKFPGLIFVPLAFYFGSDWVTNVIATIPDFITSGMGIACNMLPALGFAMLAQMIMNKKVAPFFFIGYMLAAFFSLTTTEVAVLAIALVAAMYFLAPDADEQKSELAASNGPDSEGDGFDEF